jgi:hypothetical protein
LPSSFWLDCCVLVGFANEETKGLDRQGLRELQSAVLLQNAVLAKGLDGQRLRELQNVVLVTIFRRKEEEATGDWRKFHNELHDLYL